MRSGIPCAIGFNGFLRALLGDRALLSPSPARCASIVANLTSASRCQDHTTSPSEIARSSAAQNLVHRIPRPTSVTIAIRPSCGRETGRLVKMICPSAQGEIFLERGMDRGEREAGVICPSGNRYGTSEKRQRKFIGVGNSDLLEWRRCYWPVSSNAFSLGRYSLG
jgi:hypothetical protein